MSVQIRSVVDTWIRLVPLFGLAWVGPFGCGNNKPAQKVSIRVVETTPEPTDANSETPVPRTRARTGANQPPVAPPPSPTPVPQTVTFGDVKEGLILPRCTPCHTAAQPERTDLTRLRNVREVFSTIMAVTMLEDEARMPPPPAAPLTTEEKKLFADWVVGGFVP